MRGSLFLATIGLGLAGCATSGAVDDWPADQGPVSASADLRDFTGRSVGSATLSEANGGLRIRIDVTALPPGPRAAHIHTTGQCQGPDFSSAGPHWNPTNRAHGSQNPQGPHHGDLPNLMVGTDGRGSLEFVIPGASLAGPDPVLLDSDGAAVVIHESTDDYRTDPSGNAGGRIACGVVQPG